MTRIVLDSGATALGIGSTANDGTGDPLRTGGSKLKQWAADLNAMTTELYAEKVSRGPKTIYASKYTTTSGDQTANMLASWNEVLAVSGRVQWVVDPGVYALASPRNLFQLRDNVQIILEGAEFTVDGAVSTAGWDLAATDSFTYDNAIFHYPTPAVSDIAVYGGLFTIGAEKLSPFQVGDSLTHTTGSITDGNIQIIGLRQVGGNVIQVLSMDDVLFDEVSQEGTHSSGVSFSNSTGVRVKSHRAKRIGVSADFATWNNVSAIVARGAHDVKITSPRISYTGGTSILMRTHSAKDMKRISTVDAGICSAGFSGIEYQVSSDAAVNSASEQLSIVGGHVKGYQCAPGDTNHTGVAIAISKTGGATVRGAVVEGMTVDYVSPDETFSESTYVISGSYNANKNVAATSVGTTNGIQLSGADASAVIFGGRILGNFVYRSKGNSVLADHMAGGVVQSNVMEWGGWGRSGAPLIPLTSSHGIYVNVCAEVDVSANTVRNHNPGCDGSASVRSQLIRCVDSYDTHVYGNNLRGNDTTVAASAWNHAPIGFAGSAFTLDGYTSRACSLKVGRNNIFGTYFGLVGPDGGHVVRQGGATGIITVYEDEFVCVTTATTQAVNGGVLTILAARTSATQTITLPDPTYHQGQKVTVKHQGLGTGLVTIATAAGTLWPASPTLANTGEFKTFQAIGAVWEQVA